MNTKRYQRLIWLLPIFALSLLGWSAAMFAFGVMFERENIKNIAAELRPGESVEVSIPAP